MIYVKPEDINKISKLTKDNRLIVANASYLTCKKGNFYILEFLANIVNKLQKFTRKNRDSFDYYFAHSFILIKKNNSSWVFEMDKKRGGKLNNLLQSNTFNKMKNGLINIYILPKEFKKESCEKLVKQNINRQYSLRRALTHATFIPKWIYIFFTKKPKNADMCSQNIIDRWLPVVKSDFKWNYNSKMPEDLEYYLKKDLKLKPITLKIVNEEIKWNT